MISRDYPKIWTQYRNLQRKTDSRYLQNGNEKTTVYGLDPCDYIKINLLMLTQQAGIKNHVAWLKKALREDFARFLPNPQQITIEETMTDDERYTEILKIYEKRKQATS